MMQSLQQPQYPVLNTCLCSEKHRPDRISSHAYRYLLVKLLLHSRQASESLKSAATVIESL